MPARAASARQCKGCSSGAIPSREPVARARA
jgi:hypothetical protein